MLISEIIEKASLRTGGKQKIAEGLHIHPARISDWLAGRRKPEAAEIALLAEMAGMPILETVVEVEEELNDKYKDIWKRILNDWRAQRDSNPRPLPSEGSTVITYKTYSNQLVMFFGGVGWCLAVASNVCYLYLQCTCSKCCISIVFVKKAKPSLLMG